MTSFLDISFALKAEARFTSSSSGSSNSSESSLAGRKTTVCDPRHLILERTSSSSLLERMSTVLIFKSCAYLSYSDLSSMLCVNRFVKSCSEDINLWVKLCHDSPIEIEEKDYPNAKRHFKLGKLKQQIENLEDISMESTNKICSFLSSGGNPNISFKYTRDPCPCLLLPLMFHIMERINRLYMFHHSNEDYDTKVLFFERLKHIIDLLLLKPELDINLRVEEVYEPKLLSPLEFAIDQRHRLSEIALKIINRSDCKFTLATLQNAHENGLSEVVKALIQKNQIALSPEMMEIFLADLEDNPDDGEPLEFVD